MSSGPPVIRLTPMEQARLRRQVLHAFAGVNRLTLRPMLELLDKARDETDARAALAARLAWHLAPLAEQFGGPRRGELLEAACALSRFAVEQFPQWVEVRVFLGQRLLDLAEEQADPDARLAHVQEAVESLRVADSLRGGLAGIAVRRADALLQLARLTPRLDIAVQLLMEAGNCLRHACESQDRSRVVQHRLADVLMEMAARLSGLRTIKPLEEARSLLADLVVQPECDASIRQRLGECLLQLSHLPGRSDRESLLRAARTVVTDMLQSTKESPASLSMLAHILLDLAPYGSLLERQAVLAEIGQRLGALDVSGPALAPLLLYRAQALNDLAELVAGPERAQRRRQAQRILASLFELPLTKTWGP